MNNSTIFHRFNQALFTRPSAALAIQAAWLLLAAIPSHAATRVWLNPVSGGWSVAANWSGGAVPVAGDNAYITNSGTFAVTNDAGATFATLTLGGTAGTQSLNWSSGSLTGSTIIGTNGVLILVGSGTKNLFGAITNDGQVVWSSGSAATWYWYGVNGARLENRPGGLLDVQLDGVFSVSSGTPVINNAGTFRKSGGSGALTMTSFVFTNSGLVNVQTGGMTFSSGFGSTGTFDVTNGAAVSLSGGTFTFAPGHTFTGNGFYGVPVSGSATIKGPIINTNFQMTGNLTITNELTGTLWWNSGQLNGALTVAAGGALNLVGPGAKYLFGAITNDGQVVWSSGSAAAWYWYGTSGARLENRPGGLLDVQLDGTFTVQSGTPVIYNAGTFRKSGGAGALTMASFVFTNSGLVNVQTGGMTFTSGFGSSGTFDVTNGTAVSLSGGTFTFAPGHTFTGNGFYGVPVSGSATIKGPIINTNFQLTGSMYITNELTGTLWWNSGGQLYGALTVAAGGALNLVGPGAKYLFGAITNDGQVVWKSGSAATWYWYGASGARLENRPGGLLDVQLDGVFTVSSGTPVIHNAGTFRKSGGGGALTMASFVFTNSGLVNVQTGGMTFTSGFGSSGTFDVTNGTAVSLMGGTFTFAAGHTFTGNGFYGVPVSGSATIKGPIINTNFQLSGSLTITNELNGRLWWNGGYLYGALTVSAGGALNLVGPGVKYLFGAITNDGQVVWSSGSAAAWYWYGVNGARLENRPAGLLDAQLDGAFTVSSGTPVIRNAGTFRKSGGSGTLSMTSFAFGNQGTLHAQIGTIQLPTLYSETSSANLAVSLGGTTPGTQYGRIQFSAAPAFAGKFTAVPGNGFSPSPVNSFNVLSYPSASGSFIAMDGLDYGNGLRLAPHFSKTNLMLTTVSVPTSDDPTLLYYPLPGSLLVCWPVEFAGYTLYSTTNIAAPVWTPLPVAGINNTVVPAALPRQYFRAGNP